VIDFEGSLALIAQSERADELAGSRLVEQLAVLGTFDPAQLKGSQAHDVVELLCQQLPSQDAILDERRRIDALVRMLERGGRQQLAKVRRRVKPHEQSPLQRMLDAFVFGTGPPVEERSEDELLASLEVWRWATEAVARAHLIGGITIEPTRDAIESRLALMDVTRAVRRLSDAGLVGREAELDALRAYRRSDEPGADLTSDPALVVYGIGGVGKSTLVARFVMDLYEEAQQSSADVWAYLDLDRPTLASSAPAVILADIIRQVAAQLGDERRGLMRSMEELRERRKGAGIESYDDAFSYREQASEFAGTMASSNTPVLVVLDTYEQIERNHPERAEQVYDLFAVLASAIPRFRLIVSGRAPADDYIVQDRPDRQLHVRALGEEAALNLLAHSVKHEGTKADRPTDAIDLELGREVIELVGGIPLTIRLAARVLVQEGPEAIADAAERARTLDRVRSEFVRGFLYQRILGQITARPPVDTEDLRWLARAGITLRRITVDLVERVLVPSLRSLPEASPRELFDALSAEVAFAERDAGALRLREELRAPALVALRLGDPQLVERVHQHAVDFYAALPGDPDAMLELAYHRLALGAPPSEFDEQTLRRLEPVVDDLSPSSATQVREAIGDGSVLAAAQNLDSWERKVLPEADAALRAGQIDRARTLLSARKEHRQGTELHRLESRLAQAEGNLVAATSAAGEDLTAARLAADPRRYAAAAVRLALLHERQGHGGEADAVLLQADEDAMLAGLPALRLELLLNRINLLERAGLEKPESRWLQSLEARALMQRTNPRELATSSALARLLAAALGSEEPDRLREAVRRVGVGYEEDSERVQQLVDAMAKWDREQPEPGRLARKANLRLDDVDATSIRRAWSALMGLGTDAGLVLDRLWRQETPPKSVRERLRQIYLWWAVEEDEDETAAVPETWPDFLTTVPLDWSHKPIRDLERLVLTAYPTTTDSIALASVAGLDLSRISWASSGRRTTREMLGTASRMGRLEDLTAAVLRDPGAISVHPQLRELVGETWLSAHGL
jgi:hypothetical protein